MRNLGKMSFLLIICLFALVIFGQMYMVKNTSTIVVTTVTDKERVTYNSGETIDSKYLIFTEAETFECTDQFIVGKFNSSDVYGMIKEGKKYKFTVYGVRVPFMSMYRNIVNVEEVR